MVGKATKERGGGEHSPFIIVGFIANLLFRHNVWDTGSAEASMWLDRSGVTGVNPQIAREASAACLEDSRSSTSSLYFRVQLNRLVEDVSLPRLTLV
jgi:hypothetical protein